MGNTKDPYLESPAFKAYLALGRLPKNCPAFEMKNGCPVIRKGEVWCRMPGSGQQGLCAVHQYSRRDAMIAHFVSDSGHLPPRKHGLGHPVQAPSHSGAVIAFYEHLMRFEDYEGKSESRDRAVAESSTNSSKTSTKSGKRLLIVEHQHETDKKPERGQTETQTAKKPRCEPGRSTSREGSVPQSALGKASLVEQHKQAQPKRKFPNTIDLTQDYESEVESAAGAVDVAAASQERPPALSPLRASTRGLIVDETAPEEHEGVIVGMKPSVVPAHSPQQRMKLNTADTLEPDEDDLELELQEFRIKSQLRQIELQDQLHAVQMKRKAKALQKRKALVK